MNYKTDINKYLATEKDKKLFDYLGQRHNGRTETFRAPETSSKKS